MAVKKFQSGFRLIDGDALNAAFDEMSSDGEFTDITVTGNAAIGNAPTDLLGFHGATQVAQAASVLQTALPSLLFTTGSSGWSFVSSAQVAGVINLLSQIRTALVALGLIKGGA